MSWAALCMGLACLGAPSAEEVKQVEATAQEALEKIPGKHAFAFTEITADSVQPLFGVNAKQRLAVGSTFKLFILGRLIEEVNQDRRQISDTMRLEARLHGPPHSEMADWPVGSVVTLNTLALKMIWVSDNTATDHLHFLLGREAIERQMEKMGHGDPALNIPLLNTREMTSLRDKKQGLPGKAYQKLSVAEKRKFLDKLDQGVPDYEKLDFDTAAYDISEWYASPLDMAHGLAWIYRHTLEDAPAHAVRVVLTADVKLPFDKATWKYVGFKGGSEDQILAGNWLLQHRNGKWYTLHIYLNNPSGPVSPEKAMPQMVAILKAIEESLAESAK